MRTITAKFTSKCAKTGATIKKGETCLYDPTAKKAYKLGAIESTEQNEQIQDPGEQYFDNFCQTHGI